MIDHDSKCLDSLAELAARALEVPAALVSLFEQGREVVAGRAEPLPAGLLRTLGADRFARGEALIVGDARADAGGSRALVEQGFAAYAGVALLAEDGAVIGAVLALDHRPRSWTERELEILSHVARLASEELRSHARRRLEIELAADLRRTLQARDEVLATLTHDMRSLLQGVSLSAQLLSIEPADADLVRGIRRSAIGLGELANELSRLRSRGLRGLVAPEPARPEALLESARTAFAPRSARDDVRIEIACPLGLPAVLADPARVQQVLRDLLEDALDDARPGASIELSATRLPDRLRFEVRSREPFARSRRRDEDPDHFLSSTIVEAHNGEIGRESEPGAGACAWFTLPVAPAEAQTGPSETPARGTAAPAAVGVAPGTRRARPA